MCSLLLACSTKPVASARQVTSQSELLGGPRALGQIGDYRISNSRVRFIVQDIKAPSRAFGAYGGSLIDADLARDPEVRDPRGQPYGSDGLGEIFPSFFLSGIEPQKIEILDDGSRGGTARLRVTGAPGDFYTSTALVDQTLLGTGLTFAMDYALGPDDDFLAITPSIINATTADHFFPVDVAPVPVGIVALFGDGQGVFLQGEPAWDVRFSLEKAYARDYKLPAVPGVTSDVIAIEGKDLSYGLTFCSTCPSPLDNGLPGFSGFAFNHRDQYSRFAAVSEDSLLLPFISGTLFGVFAGEPPKKLPAGKAFSTTLLLRVSHPSVSAQTDGLYAARGDDVGRVAGILREQGTELPLEGVSLIVLEAGTGRAVTSIRTSAGGRFQASLPEGSYTAQARKDGHFTSAPLPFSVASRQDTFLTPHLPRAALLAVEAIDETGRLIPAKVTLDAAYDVAHAGADPRSFLYDLRLGEPYRPTDLVPDTADPETRRYIEAVARTPSGRAELEVRPGKYRVTVSRGPQYSLSVTEGVTLTAGEVTRVAAHLTRVVQPGNFIAADLHVHAIGSVDSPVPLEDRLTSYAVEGIDFLALTEHNFILDPRPTLQRMGLQDFVQATAGIEISSLEAGHWNAYPLTPLPGPATHGSPDWFRKDPQQLFDAMRKLGTYGAKDTVVQVNHPRDPAQGYFNSYGLTGEALNGDPAHDWPGKTGLFAPSGPGFEKGAFSLDFDAVELLTGKRFDLLRTYRVPTPLPPQPRPPPCGPQRPPPCTGAPGTIVLDTGGLVAFPGAVEDYAHLLDAGHRYAAVSNSDSHLLLDGEGGYPRNLIDLGHAPATARDIAELDVVHAIKAGRVIMTDGPQLIVTALDPVARDPAGKPVELPLGSVVAPAADGYVRLRVIVDAPEWMDLQRGTLFVSRGPCDETAADCRAVPLDIPAAPGVRRFDKTVAVSFPKGRDGWVAVQVEGDKPLWPVVIPLEIPPLLINDAVDRLASTLGVQDKFGNLKPKLPTPVRPWALSNPVYVDGNGDGQYAPPAPVRPVRGPGRELDLRKVVRSW